MTTRRQAYQLQTKLHRYRYLFACLLSITDTVGRFTKAGNAMNWEPFFDGNYEVSSCGLVRRKTPGRNTYPGKELKRVLMGMGYYVVNPCLNGVNVYSYVHVLVARYFIGDRPEGMDINHIDGDKLNNNVSNLEYVTHRENMRHARRMNLIKDATIFSDEIVAQVRSMSREGLRSTAISKVTGVSARHCRDIINNKARV